MATPLDMVQIRKRENDYYFILGCDRTSTAEQLATEYKIRAKRCHPDRFQTEEERSRAAEEFVRLNKAKEVLLDTEMRRRYDQWIESGLQVSFEDWLSLERRIHPSMHWGGEKKPLSLLDPQQKEDSNQNRSATDGLVQLTSLDEFRKGSSTENSLLQQFRSYNL